MSLTSDPKDPNLTHGVNDEPVEQAKTYLVDDGTGEFVRPVRHTYVHDKGCGAVTTMGLRLAETYARDPKFYGATYCVGCRMHRPVSEFVWDGTDERVGS
ncbi:hypothetical protein [Terrabacter terrigena]|uniref:Uncharacterized protein n=1 Tax=Terrabacter terrigena TaxID=574718 RepID=A0ABW3MY14_9MICO